MTILLTLALLSLPLARAETPANECPSNIQSLEKRLAELDSADTFAKKKATIQKWTVIWENLMGREISHTEYLREQLVSRVRSKITFDLGGAYKALPIVEPLVADIQRAYHSFQRIESIQTIVDKLLSELRAGKDMPLDEIHDFVNRYSRPDDDGYAALRSPERERVIDGLDLLKRQNELENFKNIRTIARLIDEYEAAMGYISKTAKQADAAGAAAKIMLDKLKNEYVLQTYFEKLGEKPTEAASLRDLHQILNKHPDGELYRLRMIRNREAWTWFLTVAASDKALLLLEKSLAKSENLLHSAEEAIFGSDHVDFGAVRTLLRTAKDYRLRAQFFPQISEILESQASIRDKLKKAMEFNAGKRNQFLFTFARRADARDQWNLLKTEAKKYEEEFHDSKFRDAFDAAEKDAKGLDDMPEGGNANKAQLASGGTNLLILLAAGYFGFSLVDKKEIDQDPSGGLRGGLTPVPTPGQVDTLSAEPEQGRIDTLVQTAAKTVDTLVKNKNIKTTR